MNGLVIIPACILGGIAIVFATDAFHRLADRISSRGEDWGDETEEWARFQEGMGR